MIDWTEIPDGDVWELFARDFLAELKFTIDVGPGRGADAGRDLIVSEQVMGKLHTSKFVWLVSCKHFAAGNRSVGPADESNITDRMKQHGANGFIGFYSTMPSSGLVERLKTLRSNGDIAAFQLYDGKQIEAHFATTGMSKLALRYIPESYRKTRPIQRLLREHVELRCEVCSADLLTKSVTEPYSSIVVTATRYKEDNDVYERGIIEKICAVCKGDCDRKLDARLHHEGLSTGWQDIGDLTNPLFYLKVIMAMLNRMRSGQDVYSDEAFESQKEIIIALAQRTLREITDEDMERVGRLVVLDELGF